MTKEEKNLIICLSRLWWKVSPFPFVRIANKNIIPAWKALTTSGQISPPFYLIAAIKPASAFVAEADQTGFSDFHFVTSLFTLSKCLFFVDVVFVKQLNRKLEIMFL